MRITKEELKTRPIRIALNVVPVGRGKVTTSWAKPMKITELMTDEGSFPQLVRDLVPDANVESVQVEIETGISRKSLAWHGGPLDTLMASELSVQQVLRLVRAAATAD